MKQAGRALGLGLLAAHAAATGALAGDWPSWRGPDQSGAAREAAAVTSWSPAGTHLLWKLPFGGRNTPIVLNGRVYFNAPVDEGTPCSGERVVCVNADSGELIWERRFHVFLTDIVENRVGWTSVAGDPETGNIYCHGTGGELICWDGDGNELWRRSLTEEFGRISGYGGRLFSPIVDEDRVVISFASSSWGAQARGAHRILALDKHTGEVVWWADPAGRPPQDTTYATPVVAVIDGERLIIAPNADGWVYALHSRTGRTVWKFQLSKLALNSSPVVDGHYVYVAHGEENVDTTVMGRLVCVDGRGRGDITKTNEVWRVDGLGMGYASPAVASGRVYAVDNSANLYCVDARDGRVYWQYSLGRVGKGSPVVTADGVIYVGEQNGIFYILRDAGDHAELLSRCEFPPRNGAVDELFGSPAVCGGRVYFMTRYATYALGKPGTSGSGANAGPAATAADAAPQRTDSPEQAEMTPIERTMIRPAEVTLAPGETVAFALSAIDERGERPGYLFMSQEPQWEVVGLPGELGGSPLETFTAAADASFAEGEIRVHWVGQQPALARVRILPRLPLMEDFEQMAAGSVPPGWVAAGGRVKVVERDGSRVLMKLASRERPSPPFMRLQTYFTAPLPAGYTVECEMMSEERDAGRRSFLPDMGLINTRYLFQLSGADRKSGAKTGARIETWGAVPRLRRDVAFDWAPGVWYRVKFEVRREGDKALCRAKAWRREQSEPGAWQFELVDECPHVQGAAGLYCYSNGTTARSDGPATYFDNLKVYTADGQ